MNGNLAGIDGHAAIQYVGAGLIIGSMFYLVLLGKIDPNQYWNLCMLILAGIGVYKTTTASPTGTTTVVSAPPTIVAATPATTVVKG